MKRIVIALCVLALVLSLAPAALAYTVIDTVPDTSEWGLSRTRFREAHDGEFSDGEVDGFRSLIMDDLEVEGYTMDAYLVFGEKKGSYYGLSRIVYLLDVSKKVSDASLKKCYAALTGALSEYDEPASSDAASSVWHYDDCDVEIAIGRYTEYNGSKNKTVAVVYTAPEGGEESGSGAKTSSAASRAMKVTAEAACDDYNHVGNEWAQEFYVNGSKLRVSSEYTLAVGDTVTVRAVVTDKDQSPDKGEGSASHRITQRDLDSGFTVEVEVRVTEDKGRYKGYTAAWTVSFSFSRAE